MRRLLLVALAALAACPAAAGHGGGGQAQGFRSTLTATRPPVAGLEVRILDGDDRLALRNKTGGTIVVLGYEQEPYLRFTPDAVYRNARSPATYLNEDRYAQVDLPATADPKAPPVWEKVAGGGYYEWHDHRIHWMSTIPPPAVRAAKDKPHHVFGWTVPARLDRRPLALLGSLDYTPQSRFPPLLVVPLIVLAVLAAATWWRRRRSTRKGGIADASAAPIAAATGAARAGGVRRRRAPGSRRRA